MAAQSLNLTEAYIGNLHNSTTANLEGIAIEARLLTSLYTSQENDDTLH